MKKKSPLVLILAVVCGIILLQSVTAQNIKFQMGPEYKLKKITEMPNRFLYGDNSSTFLLRKNIKIGSVWAHAYSFGLAKIKSTASVEKYDGKFNQLFDKDVMNADYKDLSIEDIMWSKDKFIMLTTRFDKNTKTNTAYGNFMSSGGDINPKAINLMKMEVDNKHNTGDFDFAISDDSSKILVYANPPYEKKDYEKFAFNVYNNNLELLWEKTITLPYLDKLVTIYDKVVSNNGDVYILIKKYDGEVMKEAKKGEKGREANYKFMVLAYTNKGSDLKEYTIDLNGKFVVDPDFKLDKKGNLAFAGFYTDKLNGSERGIFYLSIDAESKAVKTLSTKEFSQEMIDAMGKNALERKKKGGDAGLRNFVFRNFILRDDGGAMLLAENHYVIVTTTTSTSNGMTHTTTRYTYYYNDIIAISVDNKGSIEWFSRIPKKQIANADLPDLSFAPFVVGDKVYLIYNDNLKNMEATGKEARPYLGKGGVAIVAIIDHQGKVTKRLLFNAKDKATKTNLYAKISRQISPNTVAVYMQSGKKYHIGSVTIE